MPNNTWDVWANSGWVPYKRAMFSQPTFGYGTQVRGYRAIPADGQAGTPAGVPGESAAPTESEHDVARATRVAGSETTYAPQETVVPPAAGGGFSGPAPGGSSGGPAMPNEHFISP